MANIKSQKKRNRQNETRRMRNKGVRSELRTRVKSAEASIAQSSTSMDDDVRDAQRGLAKAANRNVIHPNAASRRQSRLMKKAATG